MIDDAVAPKILSGNQQAVTAVFGQLDIHRRAAQKRIIAQNALAEAVNGINRGVVELPDGSLEADNQPRPTFLSQCLFEQTGQKHIARMIVSAICFKVV